MAAAKFWKRTEELNKVEENFAKTLVEVEANATEFKKDLKNFLLDSVKEVSLAQENLLTTKNVLVATVPYCCHKIFARVAKYLTIELEKKFKQQVFFVIKREIQSKWNRASNAQKRPRSFTLNSVFDASLEDLMAPAHITGKRIRCRVDGSKFFKVQLDAKDKDFMEKRVETIGQLYKKMTTRDIVFDFKVEQPFYEIKK